MGHRGELHDRAAVSAATRFGRRVAGRRGPAEAKLGAVQVPLPCNLHAVGSRRQSRGVDRDHRAGVGRQDGHLADTTSVSVDQIGPRQVVSAILRQSAKDVEPGWRKARVAALRGPA